MSVVNGILVIARVRIHDFDLPVVTDYYFDVKERLDSVEGSHGLSVWRDEVDREAFLVIYEYEDVDAAERGLAAVTEVRALAETQAADFRPADVQRVQVKRYTGERLSATVRTAYLSMSHRIADPGYSPELLDEIERIFDELQYLPGCLGSVYGANDALEEEVIGIVTWRSREAFEASIPRSIKTYDISVYSRFY